MDMLPIYSVPLDELMIDEYGRLSIERPAFVEVVEKVREFQLVSAKRATSNQICTGNNANCENLSCGGSTNESCSNSSCNHQQ